MAQDAEPRCLEEGGSVFLNTVTPDEGHSPASTALPQRKQGHKHVAGGAVLRSGRGCGHKLCQIAPANFGFQVKENSAGENGLHSLTN